MIPHCFLTNLLGNLRGVLDNNIVSLRFNERLTNFFASIYSNNSKYNSSYLLYLRLLFERNTKFKSTFAKLGNVFRNSKWNDLKVQNVKVSLINSWFSTAFFFLVTLFILGSFFGYLNYNQTVFLPAFISEVSGLFFFILSQFSNSFSLLTLKVGFFLLACKLYIFQLVGFVPNLWLDFTTTKSTQTTVKNLNSPKSLRTYSYGFSLKSPNSDNLIDLTYSLSKTVYSLNKLNDSKVFQNFITRFSQERIFQIEFLLKDVTNLPFGDEHSWGSQNICKNILSYKPDFNFMTKNINLTLDNLNTFSNHPLSHTLTNFNVYTNLNQSKQNRWLLKNSLLANTNSTNLFSFTQAKTLVGNSLYSSNITSSSIWNSAKFSQLTQINELNNLSFFNNSFAQSPKLYPDLFSLKNSTQTSFQNFNFFENSQIWNTKKYFFTNQLKHNLIQLQNTPVINTNVSQPTTLNTVKLSLLLNTQNQVLTNQITGLYLSNLLPLTSRNLGTKLINTNSTSSNINFADVDKDHLVLFNSNFLTTLITSSAINQLPVYHFASFNHRLSLKSNNLSFKA